MTNIDARAIHQAVCAIDGCDSPLPSDQQRAEHLTPLIAAAVDAARAEGDKQGAARVREAVKAGACDCGGDAVRHTVGADRRCPVHGYGTHVEWRFIRAALTEAAPHE